MVPTARDTGSQAYTVKVCPNCGGGDTIIYEQVTDRQWDLFGNEYGVYTKLRRPVCSRCGRTFSRDEQLEQERRRI